MVVGAAWLVVGLALWGAGAVGVGVALEDRCLAVAAAEGYGASTQAAALWPPRLSCTLSGPDAAAAPEPLVVEQAGAGMARSGWVLGFPVAWVVVGGIVLRRPAAVDPRRGV